MRIHEYLNVVDKRGRKVIACAKCGHEFCGIHENYKQHAVYRERDARDLPRMTPASGDSLFVIYQEYICPGCGTLLEVDNFCPQIDSEDDKILWDTQIDID
jgi:acetone carboxylase gamma subunit